MNTNGRKVLFIIESIIIGFLLVVILVLLIRNFSIQQSAIQENSNISSEMDTQSSEGMGATEVLVSEESEQTIETIPEEKNEVDIVVFGDSIWDDYRGNNGISEQIASLTGYNIYNCAIGGTSATITDSSTDVTEEWNSRSLNSMIYILDGTVSADSQLEGHPAKDVIKSIDFSQVDYFILSYGLNDYFMHAEPTTDDYYNMDTYEGALRHSIMKLQELYPNIDILVISPTYCKTTTRDNQPSDSDNCDYGKGTLHAYVNAAAEVANEMGVHYLNAYDDFDMNASNADINLRDGVHFTEQGMTVYAQHVIDFLQELEGM